MTSPDHERLLRAALLDELSRIAPDGNEHPPMEQRRHVARRLVAQAIAGNVAAIREVYDRSEGRPAPPAKAPERPRQVVLRWLGDDDEPNERGAGGNEEEKR